MAPFFWLTASAHALAKAPNLEVAQLGAVKARGHQRHIV